MNVSGISGADYLASIMQTDASSSGSSSGSTASVGFGSGGDEANISPMGKLMSKLFQLENTDQDAFKQVAQKISDDLAAQAKNTTDTQASKALTGMSEQFAEAAKTGDMDSLKPKGPPPPPPSQSSTGSSQSLSSDAMSTAESIIESDLSGVSSASSSYAANASTTVSNANSLGSLMRQLAMLQTTDSTQFKETAQKISDDLAAKAKESTDEGESKMLTEMSAQFAEAAKTGSMDSLKPKGPPPPPRAGMGMGGNRSGSSSQDGESSSVASNAKTGLDPMSILRSILMTDLAATGASSLVSGSSSQTASA